MCSVLLLLFSTSPVSLYPSRLALGSFSDAHLSRGSSGCTPRLSTASCRPRTHQDFCQHVMCLFDTWFFSCIVFVSSPSSSTLPFRVVPAYLLRAPLGFYPSFLPLLGISLSLLHSLFLESLCLSHLPFLLFLSLYFCCSSQALASRASLSRSSSSSFSCSLFTHCSKPGGFSIVGSFCPVSGLVSFSFSCSFLFFFLLSFVVFTVCPSRPWCPFPSFFRLFLSRVRCALEV